MCNPYSHVDYCSLPFQNIVILVCDYTCANSTNLINFIVTKTMFYFILYMLLYFFFKGWKEYMLCGVAVGDRSALLLRLCWLRSPDGPPVRPRNHKLGPCSFAAGERAGSAFCRILVK